MTGPNGEPTPSRNLSPATGTADRGKETRRHSRRAASTRSCSSELRARSRTRRRLGSPDVAFMAMSMFSKAQSTVLPSSKVQYPCGEQDWLFTTYTRCTSSCTVDRRTSKGRDWAIVDWLRYGQRQKWIFRATLLLLSGPRKIELLKSYWTGGAEVLSIRRVQSRLLSPCSALFSEDRMLILRITSMGL